MPEPTVPAPAQRELLFERPAVRGDRGQRVHRAQEWLTFHGFATAIDSGFGPATERCVRGFQEAGALPASGRVDEPTWAALVAPLARALAPVPVAAGDRLDGVVLKLAERHFAERPRELGGDNRGPWVRVYMSGNEGPEWRWCAGFVTFLLKQACAALDRPRPIAGSFSCDSLAYQGREKGRFVPGADLEAGRADWTELGDCQIFLVRRTPTDWVHTGFSFAGQGSTFATLEGNTNDDGSSNGYQVCRSTRAVTKKDFVRLTEDAESAQIED